MPRAWSPWSATRRNRYLEFGHRSSWSILRRHGGFAIFTSRRIQMTRALNTCIDFTGIPKTKPVRAMSGPSGGEAPRSDSMSAHRLSISKRSLRAQAASGLFPNRPDTHNPQPDRPPSPPGAPMHRFARMRCVLHRLTWLGGVFDLSFVRRLAISLLPYGSSGQHGALCIPYLAIIVDRYSSLTILLLRGKWVKIYCEQFCIPYGKN